MKVLQRRDIRVVNTDPQRRCYNGCNFSEELVWGKWEDLVFITDGKKPIETVEWWKELNDYAVSQRGESARAEFRIKEIDNGTL